MPDYGKLLRLGTEVGRWLMLSGAEIYRIEESVHRLLNAYGTYPEVFALPNCLIVCVTTEEGESMTRMVRVSAKGTDIELLERTNDLCRRLCREPAPLDEALALVDGLGDHEPHNPPWLVLVGYILTTAFFAFFFEGDVWDAIAAGLCGLAAGIAQLYGKKLMGSNLFFRTALCSVLICGLSLFLCRLGLGHSEDAVTIGGLMVLVPGMSLTNAMREIMAGDIFSGLHRFAEVILVATAIALGSVLAMILGRVV